MSIIQLDQNISEEIENLLPKTEFIKNFMLFISSESGYKFVYPIIFLIILYVFRKNKFAYSSVILTIIFAFLFSWILKHIFDRDRPYVFENITDILGCYGKYSFPSGHATLVFWLATTLSVLAPKYKYFYFWLAILISYARIYLNCHYLWDILAWGLLGFSVSHLAIFLAKKYRKFSKKS